MLSIWIILALGVIILVFVEIMITMPPIQDYSKANTNRINIICLATVYIQPWLFMSPIPKIMTGCQIFPIPSISPCPIHARACPSASLLL